MSGNGKKLKLWGEAAFLYTLITAAVALGAVLFSFLDGAGAGELLSAFTGYILVIGMLILMIVGIGLYQTYFPVLLGFGQTRKAIVRTFSLCTGTTALLLTALIGLLLELTDRDAMRGNMVVLTGAAGFLLLAAGIGPLIGAVMLRWFKAGIALLAILSMGGGIACGLSIGLHTEIPGFAEWSEPGTRCLYPVLLAAGIVLFLASGPLAHRLVRSAEARV